MAAITFKPLGGASVLITRPVGQGRVLARRVRELGGVPVLLPGLSLRATDDPVRAEVELREALQGDLVIFTSPSAVRFAAALAPLQGAAVVATVGQGTAWTLHRHGVEHVVVPETTQDSEGLLATAALARVAGRKVAVVGAPGGRGVLQARLRERGAKVRQVNVYQRVPARLDRRHVQALEQLREPGYLLLSSGETLCCLQQALDASAWRRLRATRAVVSSTRLRQQMQQAGFDRVSVADSALSRDLLRETVALHKAG